MALSLLLLLNEYYYSVDESLFKNTFRSQNTKQPIR